MSENIHALNLIEQILNGVWFTSDSGLYLFRNLLLFCEIKKKEIELNLKNRGQVTGLN